ncbi:hypothetical protein ACFOY2_13410 [Nonomuraea purpurea]|uniref:Uncharacterized protein n=1 Tax=Nonomuraea purpurea TaxID=1849276 RepID=A0ABV8G2K4_9ACTN
MSACPLQQRGISVGGGRERLGAQEHPQDGGHRPGQGDRAAPREVVFEKATRNPVDY